MSQNDDQERETTTSTRVEARLSRHGGLSYLHIPAVDVHQSASFYKHVFGWTIHRLESDHPGFDDGSEYVSGAWVTDQVISREPGLLPYIYVDSIESELSASLILRGKYSNHTSRARSRDQDELPYRSILRRVREPSGNQ